MAENHLSTARRGDIEGNVHKLYTRKNVEQAFLQVFELTGGVPRLAAWANDASNIGKFYEMLLKLAPKEALREMEGVVIEYRSLVPSSPLNTPDVQDGEIMTDGGVPD